MTAKHDPTRKARPEMGIPAYPVKLEPTTKCTSPLVTRRVATLEREAPHVIDLGRKVGVEVGYIGIAPLFAEALMFPGDDTDWIVGPAGSDEVPVVPREQRRALERLEASGANFPVIYVAHEVVKGRVPGGSEMAAGSVVPVPRAQVAELVGPPPAPAASVELADRLSVRANQVFRAMGAAAVVAGAVAAAPFVLAGVAIGALATLDPMVLGVIPAVSARAGEPAAWYVLARWDW